MVDYYFVPYLYQSIKEYVKCFNDKYESDLFNKYFGFFLFCLDLIVDLKQSKSLILVK